MSCAKVVPRVHYEEVRFQIELKPEELTTIETLAVGARRIWYCIIQNETLIHSLFVASIVIQSATMFMERVDNKWGS